MSLDPFDSGAATLAVLVDDVPLLGPVAGQLRSVRVESQIYLPSVCEMEFNDPDLLLVEVARLVPGNLVEVRAVSDFDPIGVPVFSGQVVSIETQYDTSSGLRSLVRAYDTGHRMLHTTNTQGFPFSSYSEIVELVALKHELVAEAFPHPVVHEMVVQANETDWDFLVRLGREIGYVMVIMLDPLAGVPTLIFAPPTPAETAPIAVGPEALPLAFEVGDERIISLRAMVSGAGLAATGSTRGWDQNLAMPALGEGVVEDETSALFLQPEELAAELGGVGQRVSLTRLAENEASVEAASEGYAMRIAGAYCDIEIEMRGNPFARPNAALSIRNAGMLTGEYTITSAIHTNQPHAFGMRTQVSCSGREDRTLAGLQDAAEAPGPLMGVYPAIVVDTEDIEQMGRVLLSFPWLSETYVSPWARVVQDGAGELTGMQILPSPTDEVLVAFENGQLDTPYVLGGLYSAERRGGVPNTELVEGVPVMRAFTSRDGHQLIFNDSPELSSLTLNTTFGASCMIRLSPETGIEIVTVEGQPILITSASEVTVNAEGAVVINAAEVTVNGEGAVSLSAEGAVSVSGSVVSMASEGAIEIEGSEISLTGAVVNIAGGIVNLGA